MHAGKPLCNSDKHALTVCLQRQAMLIQIASIEVMWQWNWQADLAHHAIGKGRGHSKNKVDKECWDKGQMRIYVGHCGCPCPMLPICMKR